MANPSIAEEIRKLAIESLENQKNETLRNVGSQLGIHHDLNRNQLVKQILSMLTRRIFQPDHIVSNIRELRFQTESQILKDNPILQYIVTGYNSILSKYNVMNPWSLSGNVPGLDLNISEKNAGEIQNLMRTFNFEQGVLDNCICSINPAIQKRAQNANFIICKNSNCQKSFHFECLGFKEPIKQNDISIFECPYCLLYKMDPLNEVQEILITPFILVSSNIHEFNISSNTYQGIKEDPSFGIEIRCLRIEGNLYENTWPDSGDLYLNNKPVHEFKPLQNNSSLKKRKDEKYFTRDIFSGKNCIKIKENRIPHDQKKTYRIHENATYMVSVSVVKKLDFTYFCQRVVKSFTRNAEESKRFIIQRMNEAEDIRIDKVNISLLDPMDSRLIRTPVRGRFCKHPQCFSLENFVQMTGNMIPRRWKCPHCQVKCLDLWVDGFVLEILESIRSSHKSIKDLVMGNNGSFELKEEREKEEFAEGKVEHKSNIEKKVERQKSSDPFIINIEEEEPVNIMPHPNISDGKTIPLHNKPIFENLQTLPTGGLISAPKEGLHKGPLQKISEKPLQTQNNSDKQKDVNRPSLPTNPQLSGKASGVNQPNEAEFKKKSSSSYKTTEKPELDFSKMSNQQYSMPDIYNNFSASMNTFPFQNFFSYPNINFITNNTLPNLFAGFLPNFNNSKPNSNDQMKGNFNINPIMDFDLMNFPPNIFDPNIANSWNMNFMPGMNANGFQNMHQMNAMNSMAPVNLMNPMGNMSNLSNLGGMNNLMMTTLPNPIPQNANTNVLPQKYQPMNSAANKVKNPLTEVQKSVPVPIPAQKVQSNQNQHPNANSLDMSLITGDPKKKIKKDVLSAMEKFNLDKEFYNTYKGLVGSKTNDLKRLMKIANEPSFSDFNSGDMLEELEKSAKLGLLNSRKEQIVKMNTFLGKVYKRQFYDEIHQDEKRNPLNEVIESLQLPTDSLAKPQSANANNQETEPSSLPNSQMKEQPTNLPVLQPPLLDNTKGTSNDPITLD